MDRRVNADLDWVTSHIDGAPEALRARVEEWLQAAGVADGSLEDRLADAGALALDASDAPGAGRESALDLLAADALITLALLHRAEYDPGTLGEAARRLRFREVEAG